MTTTVTEADTLKQLLSDKRWRIFSGKLYYIKDKAGKRVPFIPNKAQENYYNNKHKKNIILKARQLGFSTFIDICKLDDFLFNSYSSYGIIAQDIPSAQEIFDDKIKFGFDNLPTRLKDLFKLRTDRKGELKSEKNNTSISVDTSFRGGTLQGLHISEFGKICIKRPEKAREIVTGALNTVSPDNEVDIESTAEGNSGYFFDMTMRAIELEELGIELTDMDYKFHFYPRFLEKAYTLESNDIITKETEEYFNGLVSDNYFARKYKDVVFTEGQKRWYQKKKQEQREDMQREYPSFPKEAFNLAIKGAYYEKELSMMREQQRVGKYEYDNRLPLYTVRDLGGAGGGDETAIRWYQTHMNEIRIIDYREGSGRGLTEIASSIVNPRYDSYDTHYMPHDIGVTEYASGVSRLETAKKLLKGRVSIVKKLSISDGINAVRDIFPRCYFNEEKCMTGISRLSGYRREYDDKNGMFRDKPKHDINSNGSDAFRYLAVQENKTKVITNFEKKERVIIDPRTGKKIII